MVAELKQTQKTLYDTDYNLWVFETVKQLESRQYNAVDWENLIEEVKSLGRTEKRRLESLLTRLFEHLIKLGYWQSEKSYNQNHWKKEIRNFRKQIKKELQVSPSLKNYLGQIFDECYQDARELVSDISGLALHTFPEQPIATIEQILDENWLP